jgi:hypothetical protein
MEKRLVTRYATKSPEAADENQRRIEGVFEDLAANRPGTVSYIVLRLADDSFVQRRGRVPVDVRVSRGRLHLPGCVDADRAGGVTSCAIAVGSILDHLGHLCKRPFAAAGRSGGWFADSGDRVVPTVSSDRFSHGRVRVRRVLLVLL